MKVTAPGAFSLEGIGAWARTFAASVSQGWQVEHKPDGTHDFPWTDQAYASTHYTGAASMTWTVAAAGLRQFRYRLVGTTMEVVLDIEGTVGGTPSSNLLVQIPGGYESVQLSKAGTFTYNDAGTTGTGYADVSGGNKIQLYKSLAVPAWTAGTVRAAGLLRFEVE